MKTASISLRFPSNSSELNNASLDIWEMLIASNCQNLINAFEKKGIEMVSTSGGSFDIMYSPAIKKESIAWILDYTLRGCFPLEQVMIAFGTSKDISLAPCGRLYGYGMQKPLRESVPGYFVELEKARISQ